MKKNFFLLLFCMITSAIYSQEALFIDIEDVYPADVIEAKFEGGGLDKFSQFIREQFNYSKVTKAGKMVGSFRIDVTGNIKNIRIIEMMDVESATEFIRVLNNCPKWEPAKRAGKPISIEIKYPMVFNINLPESKATPTQEESGLTNDKNKVFKNESVEVSPTYRTGGIELFYKFIEKNYLLPEVEGLKGKILVSFIVDVDGSLTNIQVLKDIGYGTGKEAIRVLKKSPKWTPGMQDGIPVRVLYSLPINITTN